MNIRHHLNNFPYIIIDKFYNQSELNKIWEELNFLCYSDKLQPADETCSATDHGVILKKNSGLFLDVIYQSREISNILTVNRKIFVEFDNIFKSSPSWFYNQLYCNHDITLISYYENSDYYKFHKDNAIVTALTWFFKEPKSFSGGNLALKYNEDIINIEVKNNRCLLFPSCIPHSVDEVCMEDTMLNKKRGRFCMTQFLAAQ